MVESMLSDRLLTGVSGLDEILSGGLLPGRSYLIVGGPGSGKTTLGMHFLETGARAGEAALFIHLSESEQLLRFDAAQIGVDLSGVRFLDIRPLPNVFRDTQTYDIFPASEVESEPITTAIVQAIDELRPRRVFLDTVTHFRYLAPDNFQFRRRTHSFLRYLVEQGATVLFTVEESGHVTDDDLRFICDGMIYLDNNAQTGERLISVVKFRGSSFHEGSHAMRLTGGGMRVFPNLVPTAPRAPFIFEPMSSGIPELDELLHGGLERGTVTVISGPTGVGKTSLGMQFVKEAAGRGERSVLYTFEEWRDSVIARSESISVPVRAMLDHGMLSIVQVDPLEYVPGEFALAVRRDVEENGTRIVMIDSTAGYRLSLRGSDLTRQLHALCKYLTGMGVTVLLINEIGTITGAFHAAEGDISYMADNLIFLRYMEYEGSVHRVIGVLKKRVSSFETTLREFQLSRYGIKVGKPLTNLRGVLTGNPERVPGANA